MRPCPNCGQQVTSDDDRFCPHCGFLLPPAPAGNATATPPQPQPQPTYQAAPQATYTATAPNQNTYAAPSYTSGGVSGGNLPSPRVQRAPTPVAPAQGADPTMNTLMSMVRSVVSMDLRGLLILGVVILVVIVALVLIFKIVAWFLSLWWLWLLIIAIGAYLSRRGRRGRRLP
jgi:hypothetical protein